MKCDFCGKEFMGLEFRGIDKRTGNEMIIRTCIKCAYERATEKKSEGKHETIDRQKNRRGSET